MFLTMIFPQNSPPTSLQSSEQMCITLLQHPSNFNHMACPFLSLMNVSLPLSSHLNPPSRICLSYCLPLADAKLKVDIHHTSVITAGKPL